MVLCISVVLRLRWNLWTFWESSNQSCFFAWDTGMYVLGQCQVSRRVRSHVDEAIQERGTVDLEKF